MSDKVRLTCVCPPGTDATHAEHIETIKSRMYVGLTADQRFLPGELGMGLVEGTHAVISNLHTGSLSVSFYTHVWCVFRVQLHGL